ncbi:CDP-glucose 4,6-dehydratase [Caenimonas sp. SL110]|uniref:CDP-glucose 4,6-dehydratase n=1 Tax=Caenimonas sp. SL110 TaxID=1450524 RepID=UPI000652F461|nr:CDP-glucose 4,6-dehydratase [Caenimonas sp. SL110]
MFGGCYHGKRVLVTGHTGFKGSWLSLWLGSLGAQVSGLALAPSSTPSHWDLLGQGMEDRRGDIRDADLVLRTVNELQPDIIFHLAAQSLVRPSYQDALGTWASNVMGTAHVLEACRHVKSVRAIVAVTSDKCYENRETHEPYRETDALGGHDPYSASKAGAELVAASYRRSYFHEAGAPLLATARAGNVVGGGDWSLDRLLPDLVRAIGDGVPLEIRAPRATRPWQHVLDSLSGYLLVGQRLLEGHANVASAWNFGPAPSDICSVEAVLGKLKPHWPELDWKLSAQSHPHEAALLQLDSAKAHDQLGWSPAWGLDEALEATSSWYRTFMNEQRVVSHEQLGAYADAARARGLAWAQ